MKTINLSQGFLAIVDDDDFDRTNANKWSVCRRKNYSPYARRTLKNNKALLMHRFILGEPPDSKAQVDHINGNGLDNRKLNLRWASASNNQANRKVHGTFASKYKGVWWHKQNKRWVAEVRLKGKKAFCKTFDNELDAAQAYNKAAKEIFGEFSEPNLMD